MRRIDNYSSIDLADRPALAEIITQLYQQQPALRPNPAMHDYQLTYPPAIQIEQPEFSYTPSDEEFSEHAIGDYKNSAMYFHFGFCQYHCRYCHHYEIKTNRSSDKKHSYVQAMMQEMVEFDQRAPHLNKLIYFLGGGTPTSVDARSLDAFLDHLGHLFGPSKSSLSTVEVKPITATEEKLSLLVQAGFKRINLGVQTLDPTLYAFHHFDEDVQVVYKAIELARKCGFEYINLDILTGLENQTPESWSYTLARLKALVEDEAIDSVFIYPYHDDPRSKTFIQQHKLPDMLETLHSDACARALFLNDLGWRELGSRFYRSPRHVRRELIDLVKIRANPAYGALLYHGFGNAAFSVGDHATYLNHRKIEDYIDQVYKKSLAISHWTLISTQQQAIRDVSFDLLYSPFVRYRAIRKKYGDETMQTINECLQQWTELGLGRWNRLLGTWHLSPLGRLVHQQLMPQIYNNDDRLQFDQRMQERFVSGRAYRGY